MTAVHLPRDGGSFLFYLALPLSKAGYGMTGRPSHSRHRVFLAGQVMAHVTSLFPLISLDGTLALLANYGPICYFIAFVPSSWLMDTKGCVAELSLESAYPDCAQHASLEPFFVSLQQWCGVFP